MRGGLRAVGCVGGAWGLKGQRAAMGSRHAPRKPHTGSKTPHPSLPLSPSPTPPHTPQTKAALLLQCHMGRVPPPISDYATDTKSALENSTRICQVGGGAAPSLCALACFLGGGGACRRRAQPARGARAKPQPPAHPAATTYPPRPRTQLTTYRLTTPQSDHATNRPPTHPAPNQPTNQPTN